MNERRGNRERERRRGRGRGRERQGWWEIPCSYRVGCNLSFIALRLLHKPHASGKDINLGWLCDVVVSRCNGINPWLDLIGRQEPISKEGQDHKKLKQYSSLKCCCVLKVDVLNRVDIIDRTMKLVSGCLESLEPTKSFSIMEIWFFLTILIYVLSFSNNRDCFFIKQKWLLLYTCQIEIEILW